MLSSRDRTISLVTWNITPPLRIIACAMIAISRALGPAAILPVANFYSKNGEAIGAIAKRAIKQPRGARLTCVRSNTGNNKRFCASEGLSFGAPVRSRPSKRLRETRSTGRLRQQWTPINTSDAEKLTYSREISEFRSAFYVLSRCKHQGQLIVATPRISYTSDAHPPV